MRRSFLLPVLSSIALFFGIAAHAEPTAVHVRCSCEDEVGKAYFAAVRALIGKRAEYRIISFDQSADPGVMNINIISMPVHADGTKTRTVLSIVVTHDGSMTHEMLEACEPKAAEDYASTTVAGLHGML